MAFDLTAKLKLIDNMTAPLRKVERQLKTVDRATKSFEQSNARLSASQRSVSKASAVAASGFGGFGEKLGGVTKRASESALSIGKTAAAFTALGVAAGGAALAYGIVKVSKSALQLASNAEMAGLAFETMLSSPEKSAKFLLDLKNYAADSPFDLPGLRTSSRQMLGFGFAAESVIPMLRNFSDASSGLGLGTDGINRMTLAFGQMKAKGRVQGDEILQLAEMGIPAIQILADKMNITQAATLDLVSKGLVPAEKAIKTILDGLDKRYGGLSEKQAKTLGGMYNKLKDTFENDLLVRWGEGISSALAPRFKQLTTWIDNNQAKITKWGDSIGRAASTASDAILRKFEGAFNYIKTRYLNNPEFQNLSFEGKVEFIFSDVLRLFNDWLKIEGSRKITEITEKFTSIISTNLSNNQDKIKDAAVGLGKSIGEGLYKGLQNSLADHPILASALGGAAGARFGVPGVVAGVIGGSALSFGATMDRTKALKEANGGVLPVVANPGVKPTKGYASVEEYYANKRAYERLKTDPQMLANPAISLPNPLMKAWDGAPKKATGISAVPYNGMPAILHRGESVLPAPQAEEYRSGKRGIGNGSGGPLVHIENLHVRQESDINGIALKLAQALNRQIGAMPQ